MSNLYVVGTPIGNLEDISLRALRVFKEVDLILCEDTRVTRKLLNHYSISKETISYHAHSKLSRIQEIVEWLRKGKNLALVSDAGTPSISDPGSALVSFIRHELSEEINRGEIKIESIPGPSALIAALSISGVPCAQFMFLGFLPHKKGRETLLKEIVASERTMVFYESPHRIIKTLEGLKKMDVDNKVHVSICRELTKIFEQVVSGTSGEVFDYFSKNEDKVRGEFVVITYT